jgi:hypothetical protein
MQHSLKRSTQKKHKLYHNNLSALIHNKLKRVPHYMVRSIKENHDAPSMARIMLVCGIELHTYCNISKYVLLCRIAKT